MYYNRKENKKVRKGNTMNYNIVDIINKKRLGQELSFHELYYSFNGFLNGEIPDYQMSALLMAICLRDMTDNEIIALTDIFIKSGDVLDLSMVEGVKVDKHSTGGVGDKTTLIVGPVVAACGVKMAKMSGKGLGFTGGTIDKLESIPGFKVNLTENEFIDQLNKIGIAISCQTENLTPLDKKVYALRDVTATTESIPLIAVSIMSKKIASGADKILIDIKLGKGALIKNVDDAKRLSSLMIKIGKKYNREVRTIMTDMNVPLGRNIGNSLEVIEAFQILDGKVHNYLSHVCTILSANIISMAKQISIEAAKKEVEEVINNKTALYKLFDLIKYQHGDIKGLPLSNNIVQIYSNKTGIIESIDAYKIGVISRDLGAGRIEKDDEIDYSVGIVLNKTLGSHVHLGDVLCSLYVSDKSKFTKEEVLESYKIV